MNLFSVAAGLLILYIIIKIAPILYEMYVYRKALNKIPAPSQAPLFGLAFQLLKTSKEERVWYLHNLAMAFPDGFCAAYLLFQGFIYVCSPKHLEILLPCTENIQKSEIYNYMKPWLGEGLLTSTGKQWFQDRKLLTPTFHFNILAEFAPSVWEKAKILVSSLDKALKKNPGQPVNLFHFTVKAALDVLCETALGVNLHVQSNTDIPYVKALHNVSELMIYRLFSPWLHLDAIFNATPSGHKFKENVKIMHHLTNEIVRKRKEERKERKDRIANMRPEDKDIGRKGKRAMLDLLLDASEMSTQPLTDDQIREQVDTFLFAGHDTTAAAITWSLFCLGNYPECQQKVHEELEAVFGDSDEPPTLNQLAELKYMERVTKEALRIYPSVPMIGRMLTKDVVLSGYTIPKYTTAVIAPFSTHRLSEYWPDPLKFDPDRFLPENLKDKHPYAYIPFSAGPRNCIGQKFAQMELKMMLTAVLRKWRVKSVQTQEQMKICMSFILRPQDTVDVYLIEK